MMKVATTTPTRLGTAAKRRSRMVRRRGGMARGRGLWVGDSRSIGMIIRHATGVPRGDIEFWTATVTTTRQNDRSGAKRAGAVGRPDRQVCMIIWHVA